MQHDAVVGALRWNEAALNEVRAEAGRLADTDVRLQEVLDSRTYQLSEALRRVWWRLSRRGRS